ncbi:MAG: DNA-processing protein DprA [Nocardioides sp.]
MTEADRLARAALCRLTEPGDSRLAALVAELGAEQVRQQLLDERDLHGLAGEISGRLASLDPAGDLERADRRGIRFVIPGDDEWPESLNRLRWAAPIQGRGGVPLGLWVTGPLDLADQSRAVAIVGSRSCTSYGTGVAAEIAAVTARSGLAVVSGAAYGIDQAAHRGALGASGVTIAVLACGVDRVYPKGAESLLAHLRDHGAVVSEAPPGCAPLRLRFLSRNRLIAALSSGTVIVEAAYRSGALNTANWTSSLDRVLMGVPGPVTSAASQGVHGLLRNGAAALVTCGEDVLELVSPSGEHVMAPARGPERPTDSLTIRQRQVLDAVPLHRGAPADSIARTAGIGLIEVRTALGRLAALGLVESGESGWRLTSEVRSA